MAEVDFQEKRVRLGGSLILSSTESFSCVLRGNSDMNFITRKIVSSMFDAAREYLYLPQEVHLRMHAVLDWDDRIICSDLDFQGRSLLHVAYAGREESLFVMAPKSFVTRDVSPDSIVGSALRVGRDLLSADWAFPETEPWRCWSGDSGPRSEMFESLLPAD